MLVVRATLAGLNARWPLLIPLIACLGIQGVVSVLLLGLALLNDPNRARPASGSSMVTCAVQAQMQACRQVRSLPILDV